MPRAKNRVASRERRKRILRSNKGYFGKGKNAIKTASDAFWRAGVYAYRDRRQKKRHFRALWILRINAAVREVTENQMNYSTFISKMGLAGVELNRKALAHLAVHEPVAFKAVVASIRG